MNENKMKEHIVKEGLKRTADNNPYYSDQVKWEIKALIDACKTPEDIAKVVSLYSLIPPLR